MARVASDRGALPLEDLERLDVIAEAIPLFLDHAPAPSLVHGDVWSGNVLTQGDRITGLLDPAIYFADSEVELAFIELFGTFGNAFFDRYGEVRRIEPGYVEVRRDVYQLYPLLVHVAVFGEGYLRGLRARMVRVESHL